MKKKEWRHDIHGWIILDKPAGVTSNLVNIQVRRILGTKKTGFLGTLDPFASGILPIAIGHATKLLHYIEDSHKEYIAEICWGEHRNTYDIDGEVLEKSDKIPSRDELTKILPLFEGETSQIPPVFSAVKIKGKRACDLVRKGIDIEIKPKKIQIDKITLLSHEGNISKIKVECQKGVYIRSLAVDIARKLDALCYAKSLRRTESYKFTLKNSISLENLLKNDSYDVQCYLRPMDFVLDDIPALDILDTRKFFNGMFQEVASEDASISRVYCNKRFVGLGNVENGILHPLRVFKD